MEKLEVSQLWRNSLNQDIEPLWKDIMKELSSRLWHKSRKEYKVKYKEKEKYSDIYKDVINYRQSHSKEVANIAIWIVEYYFEKNNREFKEIKKVLYLACLTHDIKKLDVDHHLKGAEFVKNQLNKQEGEYTRYLYNIIKYHRSKKDKKEELKSLENMEKILILICRLGDKLSKVVDKVKIQDRIITQKNIGEEVDAVLKRYDDFGLIDEIKKMFENNLKEDFAEKYLSKYF